MKIVGALRVKNESRWIARVIESLRPMCEQILVFDDNSADDTAAIAESLGCSVLHSPFEVLNEARDKNLMLSFLRGMQPDWVVMIDGDEILEAGAQEIITTAANTILVQALSFEIVYLWNDEHTVRTDLRVNCLRRGSMFRPIAGHQFHSPLPGGLHCGNVPYALTEASCAARLLHLGYMLREDRLRKHAWYNRIDPGNVFEDFYSHMILGDVPELPAESVTKWGGPLRLEPLNK